MRVAKWWPSRWPNAKTWVAALILLLAAVACVVGVIADPRRAAASYLAAYGAALGVALAMLLLLMIVELGGGSWLTALRPYAEAVVATLPVLAVLFVPILVGAHALYPWTSPSSLPASLRAAIDDKQPYLTPAFALLRVVVYWGVWIVLGELLLSASRRRDGAPGERDARRQRALSAAGIPLIALTLSFASFDWLMALTPDWWSSIYPVYYFAGGSVGAVALLALSGGVALRTGVPTGITPDDLRAVGNLLLTFVLFWAYLWYTQFLVIWIADLPAEVTWYAVRTGAGWGALGVVLLVGHLVMPFLALLLRAVKQSAVAMISVGAWLLLMHYLDVYWLVMPARSGERLTPHWLDLATLILIAGLLVAAGGWRRGRISIISSGGSASVTVAGRGAPAEARRG
jgi:hypothetical protein